MRKEARIDIDNITYLAFEMPPTISADLLPKVLRIALPVLGSLDFSKGLDQDIDMSKLTNGLTLALAELEKNKLSSFMKEMINPDYVWPDGDKKAIRQFDSYFQDKGLKHIFKLLIELVKLNYSDFLGISQD